jgi:hypothetical protein
VVNAAGPRSVPVRGDRALVVHDCAWGFLKKKKKKKKKERGD